MAMQEYRNVIEHQELVGVVVFAIVGVVLVVVLPAKHPVERYPYPPRRFIRNYHERKTLRVSIHILRWQYFRPCAALDPGIAAAA